MSVFCCRSEVSCALAVPTFLIHAQSKSNQLYYAQDSLVKDSGKRQILYLALWLRRKSMLWGGGQSAASRSFTFSMHVLVLLS